MCRVDELVKVSYWAPGVVALVAFYPSGVSAEWPFNRVVFQPSGVLAEWQCSQS